MRTVTFGAFLKKFNHNFIYSFFGVLFPQAVFFTDIQLSKNSKLGMIFRKYSVDYILNYKNFESKS